jgi:DNA replication protein DnaC
VTDAPEILLAHQRKTLKLPTFLREYEKLAPQCAAEGLDHVRLLARLVELELIDRERRMIERRIKAARFPAVKSLDSFDFKAIPALCKCRMKNPQKCRTKIPHFRELGSAEIRYGRLRFSAADRVVLAVAAG